VNVLKPHKQTTIFTLLELRKSQRDIHRITGIDRKTIRAYQRQYVSQAANSPGVATGSEAPDIQIPTAPPPADANAVELAVLEQPCTPVTSLATSSACEPWREFIQTQLHLRRNATAIYQDLVDLHGFTHRYNSVKRFVAKLQQREPEQFDRLEFAPGEEAQVDYGEGALTFDPLTQRWRKPRLFVMTLRYSRRSFRRVVWKSSQQVWAQLHEQAFRYFGGVPRYVVLDNLKEGVIKPDLYEPELNSVYAAMLAHYQCVADPARVRDPNRKGTVEHAIQHTQNTALKGRRFDSISEQNEFLEHWEQSWASKRIHGREKQQVQAMFEQERGSLNALPISSFAFFTDLVRTVCDDTTVRVDSSNYAARPAAIGAKVLVRLYVHLVEIRELGTARLLRTHARSERAGSVILPDDERPFNPSRQTDYLFKQATAIGTHCLGLCRHWFEQHGRPGQRRMWGLVRLAGKYPPALVERACQQGLQDGLTSLKAIETLLTRWAQADTVEQPAMPRLTQQHPLIRDVSHYADLFANAAHTGVLQ
jgi:transposase